MAIITQITGLLMRLHGIDVSKYDESFLDKSIKKRIAETNCGTPEDYCAILEKDGKEWNILLDSLNVSYSEFFRNPLTFAVLERIVLPLVAMRKKNSGHKELRIWSAACAAGQEAYSLAMLLEELINGDSGKIDYRIFATDQNESQVEEARRGEYSTYALNNLSLKRVNRWFTRRGDTYILKPELKGNIDFAVFDLFSGNLSSPPESIFGDFDLVVCANILFYYKNEFRKMLLDKTGDSMAKGGFLVAGEAEREILMNFNYHEVFPQSGIFRK